MHETVDIILKIMISTLNDRLKVRFHCLTRDLIDHRKRICFALFHLGEVRTDQGEPPILYRVHLCRVNQLKALALWSCQFDIHVVFSDPFPFKHRG